MRSSNPTNNPLPHAHVALGRGWCRLWVHGAQLIPQGFPTYGGSAPSPSAHGSSWEDTLGEHPMDSMERFIGEEVQQHPKKAHWILQTPRIINPKPWRSSPGRIWIWQQDLMIYLNPKHILDQPELSWLQGDHFPVLFSLVFQRKKQTACALSSLLWGKPFSLTPLQLYTAHRHRAELSPLYKHAVCSHCKQGICF